MERRSFLQAVGALCTLATVHPEALASTFAAAPQAAVVPTDGFETWREFNKHLEKLVRRELSDHFWKPRVFFKASPPNTYDCLGDGNLTVGIKAYTGPQPIADNTGCDPSVRAYGWMIKISPECFRNSPKNAARMIEGEVLDACEQMNRRVRWA